MRQKQKTKLRSLGRPTYVYQRLRMQAKHLCMQEEAYVCMHEARMHSSA